MTTDSVIKRALFIMCMLLAPAVLAAIELFHPANFTMHPGMYQYLSHAEHDEAIFRTLAYPGPDWWFTLHMIQTPLIGLIAIGLWMLAERSIVAGDKLAISFCWLARAAIFVFAIYYTVLDGIGGIGLGRTIEIVLALQERGTLTLEQIDGVKLVLNRLWVDPWAGGQGSFISEMGSWAVFVASAFLAAGLLRARAAGVVTVLALLAFGWSYRRAMLARTVQSHSQC